jgi:hypothetical protein
VPDSGLSSVIDDRIFPERLGSSAGDYTIRVKTMTLESALAPMSIGDVHWMKIDVEGYEDKVLKGWNSQYLRPWIIIVEATITNSPVVNYSHWDPILISAGYKFVYFDGLNRFYVAEEHSELVPAFSRPPNVFDNFELPLSSLFCRNIASSQIEKDQQIQHLSTMLNTSEVDRSNRLDQILELTAMIHSFQRK